VPECPAEAIFEDDAEENKPNWVEINGEFSAIWLNISIKRETFSDANEQNEMANKVKDFSSAPGSGD